MASKVWRARAKLNPFPSKNPRECGVPAEDHILWARHDSIQIHFGMNAHDLNNQAGAVLA